MPGKPRRHYSEDERAMATAIANRSSRREAAGMLDIPDTTIEYWIERVGNDSDYASFVQEKERELNIGEIVVADAMLRRLERLVVSTDQSKQLSDSALAYGIMKTKIREHTATEPTQAPSTDSNPTIIVPYRQGSGKK